VAPGFFSVEMVAADGILTAIWTSERLNTRSHPFVSNLAPLLSGNLRAVIIDYGNPLARDVALAYDVGFGPAGVFRSRDGRALSWLFRNVLTRWSLRLGDRRSLGQGRSAAIAESLGVAGSVFSIAFWARSHKYPPQAALIG
jgi:hypothetical protein